MGFGLILPQEGRTCEEVIQGAQSAEKLGFDSVWLYDHLFMSEKRPYPECFVLLSALAASTRTIHMGPLVLNNLLRNPALVAKMGATIDRISKGRFQLGAGAGWYQREYQRFGFNFPTFSERAARLDEAVDIISRLWEARGSRVWFKVKYYRLNGARFSPEPYSKPRPKIFLGGRSMNLLRAVVKRKLGLNIDQDWNMGPAEVQRTLSAVNQLCQQSQVKQKMIDRTLCVRLFVGKTPTQVKKQLRSWGKESSRGHTATDSVKMKILRIAMAKLRGEFVTSTFAVTGDPNECVNQLLQYRSLGIDHFFFKVYDFRDQELLKLISDDIIKPLTKGVGYS